MGPHVYCVMMKYTFVREVTTCCKINADPLLYLVLDNSGSLASRHRSTIFDICVILQIHQLPWHSGAI